MKTAYRLAALLAAAITATSFATAAGAAQQTGGSRLWATSYHGALPGWAGATAEGVSPSGSTLFVTGYAGYSDQLGSRQWVTIAYSTATGAKLWRQSYEGTYVHKGSLNGGTALAVSPDGTTVFVSGYSTNAGDQLQNTTIAYSAATGAALWTSNAAAAPSSGPVSLTLSPDGSTVYETTGDFQILAYSASTGAALWASSATGLGSTSEAHATAISPDGSTLFVTGMSVSGSVGEYQTAAYDAATGATEWVEHYAKPNGRADVVGASVAVSPDGSRVYVAGYVNEAVKSGSAVLAYDSTTGATLWTRYSPSAPTSVVASPDGSAIFVAGTRNAGGGAVVYNTQALDPATGARLWSKEYGTAEREGDVTAMTMSPDGSTVYVTGQDQNLSDTYSFATVAYTAATGGSLWSARYSGPSPGRGEVDPAAIAVSPDGSSVFVTGIAPNASAMNSLTTVAYGS